MDIPTYGDLEDIERRFYPLIDKVAILEEKVELLEQLLKKLEEKI